MGDSILDALISDEIYFRFPEKSEGQLSKLRSKIASRTFLNKTGKKLGLQNFLQFKLNQIPIEETNMIGNTLEALIGAIYLDKGYNVFGELIIGLDIQDSISNVKTDNRDKPLEDVTIEALNIIRKGKVAKQFDAPSVFENHFAEVERLAKEKKARAAAILKATQEKFKKQSAEATHLDSGLSYYISEKGTGENLKETSKVLTHYTVYFENGKLLETSNLEIAKKLDAVNENRKAANRYKPLTADIGPDARMIAGFKEGLQQLNVGDKATLFIPYHLAYGEAGTRGIPAKSNIIFEVEILKLLK